MTTQWEGPLSGKNALLMALSRFVASKFSGQQQLERLSALRTL